LTRWYKFYVDGPEDADKFSVWVDEVVDWLLEYPKFRIKAKPKKGYGAPDIYGFSSEKTLFFICFKSLADATLFKMAYHDWIVDDFCARGMVKIVYEYDFD